MEIIHEVFHHIGVEIAFSIRCIPAFGMRDALIRVDGGALWLFLLLCLDRSLLWTRESRYVLNRSAVGLRVES